MNNFDSNYKLLANKTVEWLHVDSIERYQENLLHKRKVLEDNGWIGKTITYSFNSHGFRCDEFTSDPTIMFLGCSHTLGLALPIENTWTSITASTVNLRMANLGISAGSLDTAFRLCYGWVDKIKPHVIVLLIPGQTRFELVTPQEIEHRSPLWPHDDIESYMQKYISDETNYNMNYVKNIEAITSIAKNRNIKFLKYHSYEYARLAKNDFARDAFHLGISTNKKFADNVIRDISKM